MNPGKLPINVGIFKIIRLHRPNCQKMKDFFQFRPFVIISVSLQRQIYDILWQNIFHYFLDPAERLKGPDRFLSPGTRRQPPPTGNEKDHQFVRCDPGGHSTSHVELFEFFYLLNFDEYTAHQSAISVRKGFY